MSYNLANYTEVKDRLPVFWAEYVDGRIETELVFWDERGVCVKAFLYDGERLIATGYAHEVPGQGSVNRTSALENCETSAIGRALANRDIRGPNGNEPRPSREEMQKVERGNGAPKAKADNDSRKRLAGLCEQLETLPLKLNEANQNLKAEAEGLAVNGGAQNAVNEAIEWASGIIEAAKTAKAKETA